MTFLICYKCSNQRCDCSSEHWIHYFLIVRLSMSASMPLRLYASVSLCLCASVYSSEILIPLVYKYIYFINVEAYLLIGNLINALWGNASVWKFKRIPRRAISHFLFWFFPFSEFITVNVSRLRYIIYWSRHARRIAALSNNSHSIKMIKQQTLEYISMGGDRMRFFQLVEHWNN